MPNDFNSTDIYAKTTSLANGLSNAILSSSPTGGVGYVSGAGGSISQANFTLSGVTITGTAGQFSSTASTQPLVVGATVTISGTFAGTGSISGYANATTYYIVATNGSTTFTLSTTAGGSGVTTTAGTPTGLTYTVSSKGAGVTLNTATGQITMSGSSLASTGIVSFTVTDSVIAATDTVYVNLLGSSYATSGSYSVKAEKIAAGSFVITLKNDSATPLSEPVVVNFSIIKGANS